jgi:hypothetical protein
MSIDPKSEILSKYFKEYSMTYPFAGLVLGTVLSELYLRRSGASTGLTQLRGKNLLMVIGGGFLGACLLSSIFNRQALNARREAIKLKL